MDLSIIIISYNTKDITKKCLDTVFTSLSLDPTVKTEVLVLDNNSSDGSPEMLSSYKHPKMVDNKLVVKLHAENLGFGKGNNEATKITKADTILYLNSDTESLNDAIPNLFHYFRSSQNEFDVVGARLLERDGHTPQPSCGPEYTLPVIACFLFFQGDKLHITRYSPNTTKEVAWVSGACFMMRKKEYDAVGGFDEGIFMYMEEIDLFHRLRSKGKRVGYYPSAQFIHLGSASSKNRTQPILQVYRGYLYYYKKHFPRLLPHLKFLLQLKAQVARLIGLIIHDAEIIHRYEEALTIARNN